MSTMSTEKGAEHPQSRMTCTVDEAAEMLGIARHTAYQAVRRGEIPAIRVGKRWLVPLAQLNELLGQREEVSD